MIPIKCRFGWHNWNKWEDLGPGEAWRRNWLGEEYGNQPVLFQGRRCAGCGKAQRRVVKFDNTL